MGSTRRQITGSLWGMNHETPPDTPPDGPVREPGPEPEPDRGPEQDPPPAKRYVGKWAR